jgi:hypothetical protein
MTKKNTTAVHKTMSHLCLNLGVPRQYRGIYGRSEYIQLLEGCSADDCQFGIWLATNLGICIFIKTKIIRIFACNKEPNCISVFPAQTVYIHFFRTMQEDCI